MSFHHYRLSAWRTRNADWTLVHEIQQCFGLWRSTTLLHPKKDHKELVMSVLEILVQFWSHDSFNGSVHWMLLHGLYTPSARTNNVDGVRLDILTNLVHWYHVRAPFWPDRVLQQVATIIQFTTEAVFLYIDSNRRDSMAMKFTSKRLSPSCPGVRNIWWDRNGGLSHTRVDGQCYSPQSPWCNLRTSVWLPIRTWCAGASSAGFAFCLVGKLHCDQLECWCEILS